MFGDYSYHTSRRRLLTDVTVPKLDEWRLSRLGITSSFISNSYGNMILLGCSIFLLVLVHILAKYCFPRKAFVTKNLRSYSFSFLHNVHEIVVFFFTLSIVPQLKYFTSTPYDIASVILCIVLNIYLLCYNLRNFYKLHFYRFYYNNNKRYAE